MKIELPMDHQNIDRLFREKLDGYEVKPSTLSWSQVEKQIRPSQSQTIYWVAASVSILFISWLVWPLQSELNDTPILSEVNYPAPEMFTDLESPVAIELNEIEVIKKPLFKSVDKQSQNSFLANNNNVAPVIEKEESEDVTLLENKTFVAMEELETPALEEMIEMETVTPKEEFRAIKITYIASSQSEPTSTVDQPNDSTGVLKKFIAFADRIDPGEVLADIRTAKDNLISNGLKNKKDRGSLNP